MSFEQHLIHSCDVISMTVTGQDDLGHDVLTPTVDASGVACRLIDQEVREFREGKEIIVGTKKLLLKPRTIGEEDQVEVDGQKFDIRKVLSRNGRRGVHHLSLVLEEAR